MKDFKDRIAVVTGGGTGMGRGLARQLAAAGCHVAMCDVSQDNMEQSKALCESGAGDGVRITTHLADVSVEEDLLRFRDQVMREHETDSVHLVFNNAGIAGTGSILDDDRKGWERIFDICWYGVYYGTRTFLPMLAAAEEGHLVNTSSVAGFWASAIAGSTMSAYAAAKFAVKGFTEALITDLAIHAPHVKVSVVMPGHIGTSILVNSGKALGTDPKELSEDALEALRDDFVSRGADVAGLTPEELRQMMIAELMTFESDAPMTPDEAAGVILDGVRADRWRILVGRDAQVLDEMVRAEPENAYTAEFSERARVQAGLEVDLLNL